MDPEDLRERRVRLELTIEDLAGRIGVTPATLSRWEQMKRRPHRVLLKEWRAVLDQAEATP